MKLFINFKPEDVAYGGGNVFSLNFIDYLKEKKVNIVYDLEDDIDVYFIIDPHKGKFKKYGLDMVVDYRNKLRKANINLPKDKHRKAGKIFIRINDCDKTRPNVTKERSREYRILQYYKDIDYWIFNSQFIKDYYINKHECLTQDIDIDSISAIIYNGGNDTHFFPIDNNDYYEGIINDKDANNQRDIDRYNRKRKLRLITHHWSDNINKGYEYYWKLFEYFKNRSDYEFVFVGRKFNDENPKYSQVPVIGPYKGMELGDELRKADIYVTASVFDSGPMHVVEGLLCGLPMLYINEEGGGKNICELSEKEGFGKSGETFSSFYELVDKLEKIRDSYDEYRTNAIKSKELYLKSNCMKRYYQTVRNNT